jgi:hypothetical protein
MPMLTAIALILAQAPAAQANVVELDPAKMTSAEIKAHNAALDRKDPNYIRCERRTAPNSLIASIRICRTNAQWTIAARTGEQNARDTVEAMRSRPEGPPDPVCKDPESC